MVSNQSDIWTTPSTNSGVISTFDVNKQVISTDNNLELTGLRCKVDWVQATFPSKYVSDVRHYLNLLLGRSQGGFEATGHGIKFFDKAYRHPTGAIVAEGLRQQNCQVDRSLAYVELSGGVLDFCSQTRLRKFLKVAIQKFEMKFTRGDLTIDDFDKRLNIPLAKSAADKNNYTGFRNSVKYIESGRNGERGCSISFGRRGSAGGGKYFVIYDKSKESKGAIDSIRYELSIYGGIADFALRQLAFAPFASWGYWIGSFISGSIDFIERIDRDDKNPQRRSRLPFWHEIIGDYEKIKPVSSYKIVSADELEEWVRFQVAPSLATIFLARQRKYGEGAFEKFIEEMIADGKQRLRKKHLFMLDNT